MRLETTIDFKRGLLVEPNCLGKEITIRIDGHSGILATPQLPVSKPGRKVGDNALAPPQNAGKIPDTATFNFGEYLSSGWGIVEELPSYKSKMLSARIWFDFPGKKPNEDEIIRIRVRLRNDALKWRWRFLTAYEALTQHALRGFVDIFEERPLDFFEPGDNNQIRTAPLEVELTTAKPCSEENFIKAANAASSGKILSLEHSLLLDAWRAFAEQQFRRCVMEAGTAAEVALTNGIGDFFRKTLADQQVKVLLHRTQGLTSRIDLAKSLGMIRNVDYSKTLVNKRNAAAHRGSDFTSEQARETIIAAETILMQVGSEMFVLP